MVAKFLLGTDHFGRDVLSMVMVGAKFIIYCFIIIIMVFFCIPVGLTALYSQIDIDEFNGSNDIFGFSLVAAIMITTIFGPSAVNAIISVGILIYHFCKISQTSSLPILEQFILATKVSGKSDLRISLKHILPNISNLIIIQAQYSCQLEF